MSGPQIPTDGSITYTGQIEYETVETSGTYEITVYGAEGGTSTNLNETGGDGAELSDEPDHAILIDDILVQAGALVNGVSVLRENRLPERFTFHHVELADHALILAEGVPAETFVDNVDRLGFDNWAEHEALYGNEPSITEMPYPRAQSHRQVPPRIRARFLPDTVAA